MYKKCSCRSCKTTSSRVMEWLESEPKGISTLAVIVGFALGMWAVLSVMNLIK